MLFNWVRFAEIDEVSLSAARGAACASTGYQMQGTKVAVVQNKADVSRSC